MCPAASVRAEMAEAGRVERALCSGASGASGRAPPSARAQHRARAWLLLADICLRCVRAAPDISSSVTLPRTARNCLLSCPGWIE